MTTAPIDPNMTLDQLRKIVRFLRTDPDNWVDERGNFKLGDMNDTLEEIAELFESLDIWIATGGHLPDPWVVFLETQ